MEGHPSSHRIELFSNKPELFYTKRTRKKKNRGVRVIHAPSPELKKIQKEFADWFYLKKKGEFDYEDQVTGFMPGKSIADNAIPHLNKDWVINLDIKDFFPNTNENHIWNILRGFNANLKWYQKLFRKESTGFKGISVDTLLKMLCLNGGLPQGSPASAILANYVGMKLIDPHIRTVLLAHLGSVRDGFGFTRYADDITISFNGGNRETAKAIAYEITEMVKRNSRYEIKEQKTTIKHRSQRQLVTGVLVNGKDARIDRRLMNKMRAIIHNHRKEGRDFDAETKGMLAFIQSINEEQYNKLIN